MPILAGAAEPNVDLVLEACARYADLGCQAVSVTGPYYYKVSQDSIEHYFRELARRSPIDILIYNIPQFSNEVSLEVVKRLALDCPRIVGTKDSSRDMPRFMAALDTAEETAARLGSTVVTTLLANPDEAIPSLNARPLTFNKLYGGRDELRPTDHQPNLKTTMNNSSEALGILETQGLTAILEATGAMLKAANVKLVGKEKIGAAYMTVIVRGDVAAVTAAIEAGQRAGARLGKIVAAHVIARPHDDLIALLPG